jgi:hypothetical protein
MHKYNTNIMLPGTEGSTGHNESNQNLKGTASEAIVDVLRTLIHRILYYSDQVFDALAA